MVINGVLRTLWVGLWGCWLLVVSFVGICVLRSFSWRALHAGGWFVEMLMLRFVDEKCPSIHCGMGGHLGRLEVVFCAEA